MTNNDELNILSPEFPEAANSALAALNEANHTNWKREQAGHPPVPCQLTAEQTQALASMVWGLQFLLITKGGGL